MQIRIANNYIGSPTNNKRIEPGDYAIDDPVLHGGGEYLVKNGYAVVIDEPAPEPTQVVGGAIITPPIWGDDEPLPEKPKRTRRKRAK